MSTYRWSVLSLTVASIALCFATVNMVNTVIHVRAQTKIDTPSQVQGKNGQTIVDLSQLKNYVSLKRYDCNVSGSGWDCHGLSIYDFTMPDGTHRMFAVTTLDPLALQDLAKGPPKWVATEIK